MTRVECPECGEQFEVDAGILVLSNRLYCSVCDALLEVIDEEPVVLDVVDGAFEEDEAVDDDEDWEEL